MKIAIAGYAVEGKSNYEYFKTHGDVTIVDERENITDLPAGVPTILGEGAFSKLQDFDLVVRTASLAPRKITTGGKIWSAANEFFAICPVPIIGVTGTKGKGTTVSLIASILQAAGKTVHVVGNIGVPPLDELKKIMPDHIVLYELSSFQLWDIQRSPHVAVVLMIEADHLDVHETFNEYIAAKKNVALFQNSGDFVVYNGANSYSMAIGNASVGKKLPFPSDQTAHVRDAQFYYGDQQICSTGVLRLPGKHNVDNACAAITAAWLFTQDAAAIRTGLGSFAGLPHRLKFVRTVRRVDYYDDSIATTPGSVVAAIDAFSQPKILILGGSSKGPTDFSPIARAVLRSNVKAAILIGDQAEVIEKSLAGTGMLLTNLGSSATMHEIVMTASQQARPGDVVILSPACASFGMFENYSDRGDQFVTSVRGL